MRAKNVTQPSVLFSRRQTKSCEKHITAPPDKPQGPSLIFLRHQKRAKRMTKKHFGRCLLWISLWRSAGEGSVLQHLCNIIGLINSAASALFKDLMCLDHPRSISDQGCNSYGVNVPELKRFRSQSTSGVLIYSVLDNRFLLMFYHSAHHTITA